MRHRLWWFLHYQSLSWRRLLFGASPLVHLDLSPAFCTIKQHPSELCTCGELQSPADRDAHVATHAPECEWGKVMCHTCLGDGTCRECGGDGVRTKFDDDRFPQSQNDYTGSQERCTSFYFQYRCTKEQDHDDVHQTKGDDCTSYYWQRDAGIPVTIGQMIGDRYVSDHAHHCVFTARDLHYTTFCDHCGFTMEAHCEQCFASSFKPLVMP